MSIMALIIVLCCVGFAAWLILQIPMAANIQRIIIAVLVFFVALWVVQSLGLYNFGLRLK